MERGQVEAEGPRDAVPERSTHREGVRRRPEANAGPRRGPSRGAALPAHRATAPWFTNGKLARAMRAVHGSADRGRGDAHRKRSRRERPRLILARQAVPAAGARLRSTRHAASGNTTQGTM